MELHFPGSLHDAYWDAESALCVVRFSLKSACDCSTGNTTSSSCAPRTPGLAFQFGLVGGEAGTYHILGLRQAYASSPVRVDAALDAVLCPSLWLLLEFHFERKGREVTY